MTGDLGQRWELTRIALRMWPSATALQEVITTLYNLVSEHDVAFGDVKHVRLALSRTPFDMHGGFATYKAKFEALLSAHYVTGVFLRDRTVTLDQFEPACYDDAELRDFAANKVEIVLDESLANGQAIADVEMADGRKLSARCDHPLGSPENPMSAAQSEEKLRTCAGYAISDKQTDALVAAIAGIENLPSARSFVDLLRAS